MASKSLRLGIVLGGTLVEERLIRTPTAVTIGQSARATVSIPVEGLPRSVTLFEVGKDGRRALRLADGMDVRLSDGGAPATLAMLADAGRAMRVADGWRVPLTPGARGKIMIGELTVLFQQVVAPAVAPRPQLPQSVRGRLLDRIDPYMAAVLLFSLIAHGGAISWFYGSDTAVAAEPEEMSTRYATQLISQAQPLPLPPKDQGVTLPGSDPTPDQPLPPVTPGKKPPANRDVGADEPAPDTRGVIATIGAAGQKDDGRFKDVTNGQNPGGDLQAGIDKARKDGTAVATNGKPDGARDRDVGSTIGDGTDVGVDRPTGSDVNVKVDEDTVQAIIDPKPPVVDDDGGLDAQSVWKKIKTTYQGQLQKCYVDAAKHDTELHGRVDLTMTIGAGGNVTRVEVEGFDTGLDACIGASARTWRFEKPPTGSAQFQFPFTFRPAR